MDRIVRLRAKGSLRVAGLMSGTSADGVTVAVVKVGRGGTATLGWPTGRPRPSLASASRRDSRNRRACGDVKVEAFATYPYPPRLRRAILELCRAGTAQLEEVSQLNFILGEVFASALKRLAKESDIALESIDLVGSHGQTIYHGPRGQRFGGRTVRSTLQIGEPSIIAERTGITTVADFRPRDIAAGGEGAPLVPYADYVLFAHRRVTRAVQNIGGIANVTYLPADAGLDGTIAFDTGPGNMVIDYLVSRITKGRRRYDRGGGLAAKGAVNEPLLAELMKHRFLRRRPPKSTGREEFGWQFAEALYRRGRKRGLPPLDILATATAFTARSIADAYRRFLPRRVDEVILCGGGARNSTLVKMLREELGSTPVRTTDEFGISAEAKEAVSFAILAAETIRGVANNVPTATGARRRVVLGKIIPG